MEGIDSPALQDVQFNQDGSLKQTGKQNIKFYNKKRLSFRAKPLLTDDGTQAKDEKGKLLFEIDPKTGIPFKIAFEETVEMVRVETKGDTNIKDDIADDFAKRQFYRQYKHFREGKIPEGNPIEDFDFLQPNTIMELHMMGIHVLQQVAEMDDIECDQLKDQSGYEIRDIAAQWMKINSPQGQAGKASKLEREVVQLRRELEDAKSRKGQQRQRLVEEPVSSEPETNIETIELTPAEIAKGRPRKV